MKSLLPKFRYFSDEKALLASYIGYYEFRLELEIIKQLEENLEIIVDQNSDIVARRFDTPAEAKSYIKNAGDWKLTEVGESYNEKEIEELATFIANIPEMAMERLQDICDN